MNAQKQIEQAHNNLHTSLTHVMHDLAKLIFKQEHQRAVAVLRATTVPHNVYNVPSVCLSERKLGTRWKRSGRPSIRTLVSFDGKVAKLEDERGRQHTLSRDQFMRWQRYDA